MDKEKKDKHIEDIIDVQGRDTLPLSDIEYLSRNNGVWEQYKEKKENFYSSILMSLTHETYNELDAKRLWNKIVEHMNFLESALNRKVGISVATLDYLSNIKDILKEPKIIEENKIELVAEFSTIDELTRLYSRDVFDVTLLKYIEESKRTHSPLCLILIDVDDFKQVNDQFGHQKGDEVLTEIGACINEIVREMDLAARYGGEELAIILPNTDIEKAYILGERIRDNVAKLTFQGFSVTVSVGVGDMSLKKNNTPETLIKAADVALYKAKDMGKNRTVK